MDSTNLLLSFLFGMVGMGLVMYGKKAGRVPHLAAGVALMAVPYFITNPIALIVVCSILSVVPFFMREA